MQRNRTHGCHLCEQPSARRNSQSTSSRKPFSFMRPKFTSFSSTNGHFALFLEPVLP